MNNLSLFPEVLAIQNWLHPDFYRITTKCEDNIFIINALREQDDDVYELNIEYDCEHNTALLTIHCLRGIIPDKYLFCIELLNSLNNINTKVNYSLNLETMRVSCSQVIGFASWEANSDTLTYRLDIYTCCSINDLTKIDQILSENAGLVEATQRILGDV